VAWTQEKINKTYREARKLSLTDLTFRAELLSNPRAAIERLSGEALPEEFSLRVIESDPAYSATFILPRITNFELTDDELDNVAGGISPDGSDSCGTQTFK